MKTEPGTKTRRRLVRAVRVGLITLLVTVASASLLLHLSEPHMDSERGFAGVSLAVNRIAVMKLEDVTVVLNLIAIEGREAEFKWRLLDPIAKREIDGRVQVRHESPSSGCIQFFTTGTPIMVEEMAIKWGYLGPQEVWIYYNPSHASVSRMPGELWHQDGFWQALRRGAGGQHSN